MIPHLYEAIALTLFGLAISLAFTRIMIHLGPKLGLMDQPDERRVHVTPIPRAGGIAIWLSFMITVWVGKYLAPGLFDGQLSMQLAAFTLSTGMLMVVGVIDDRQGIRPFVKLGGQIAASLTFFLLNPKTVGMFMGYQIPYLVELAFFTGWSVLLINAFNLIDGLDGLCGGLVCISLFVIAGLELAAGHLSDALVVGIMMVCVAGFMKFNLNPAKIFLGDAGSMMLGFFLASAATQAGGRRAVVGSIVLPIAIAGVPLLDVFLAIWRRSARSTVSHWNGGDRVGVFSPDKDHLHHRFLARGLGQKEVALLMQGLAILLAALAFVPMLVGTRGIMITVCGLMILGLFGLRHLAQVELKHTGSLVHLAVKRREGPGKMRTWYFTYDLTALFIAGTGAILIETNLATRDFSVETTMRFVATFVACEMVVLHLIRIYRRVWSRSALREFLLLSMGLMIGGLAATGIFQTAAGDIAWSGLRASIIAIGSATWLLLLPRALPDVLRELAMDSSHRHLTRGKNSGKQVLVYGAGDVGNLFVKYLKTCSPDDFQRFQISGYLDDSDALKGRTINGFKILGGLDVLSTVCAEYPIHGILIAIQDLPEERMQEILKEAAALDLAVYSWASDLKPRRILTGYEPMQNASMQSVRPLTESEARPAFEA